MHEVSTTFENLIPAISSLFGVLIGGGITYFANSRSLEHQESLAKREFKTKKLEELHDRLTALETYGRNTYVDVRQAFSGENFKSSDVHHGLPEIEFLIKTLFPDQPELFDSLNEVTMKRFGHLISSAIVKSDDMSSEEKAKMRDEAFECMQELNNRVAGVKRAIYRAMKEMVGIS